MVKHKSTRRTAATAAPISYTSAQRTSVREGIADLLREVASRWCEDWHLQLPSKMSDALKASKSGGEVEAQHMKARMMMMSVQARDSSKLTST